MQMPSIPSVAELELLDGSRALIRVVVNPRARRISLRIDAAKREAVAVAPGQRHIKAALAFATERAGWIADQLARLPKSHPFAPDALVPVRGVPYRLIWNPGMRAGATLAPAPKPGEAPHLIAGGGDAALFSARVLRFLAYEALADLKARVAIHAATLGVHYTRLTVKDTKSRWGSCTSAGSLSFSWRVILAPAPVLDYLAAHEVSHLLEMNHSPRFWAQVRRCQPDYAKHRAWLRRYGAQLHAYGAA